MQCCNALGPECRREVPSLEVTVVRLRITASKTYSVPIPLCLGLCAVTITVRASLVAEQCKVQRHIQFQFPCVWGYVQTQ